MNSLPAGGRLMAIDLGDRRIGLAISDPTGTIASPAGFIERRAGKRPPLMELVRKAAELEARGFVVGLPLDAEGDDSARAAEARRLAEELEKKTGLPAIMVDERFTTAAALRAVKEMEGTTRGRKGDVDSMAATMLLQHALQLQAGAGGTPAAAGSAATHEAARPSPPAEPGPSHG